MQYLIPTSAVILNG